MKLIARNAKPYLLLALFIATIVIVFFVNQWVKAQTNKRPQTLPIRVVLSSAKTKDIPVYLDAIGTVTPTDTVTVKTQVSGTLQTVLFKEGQTVKKNSLLAKIDASPYEALLMQYQGEKTRDLALLANARIDLQRYSILFKEDSVSGQTLDTQKWLVKQYEGTVKADEGLIQTAKVNIRYCQITSPIDGRVGLRLVDPGNFVQPSDTTGLFVINRVQPITVLFTLPEDDIPQILSQTKADSPLIVKAFNRSQNKELATGKLLSIDNQIDPTTGTVKLKGEFSNQEDNLFPNQFVNVKLLIETLKHATTVPTSAVKQGPQGAFVYSYRPEQKTVHIQTVKTGIVYGEDTVIISGLTPGQYVVSEGTDKLTEGTLVVADNLITQPGLQ